MKGSQQRCVVPNILCKNISSIAFKNDAAIVKFVLDNFTFVIVVVHDATQRSSTLFGCAAYKPGRYFSNGAYLHHLAPLHAAAACATADCDDEMMIIMDDR